MAGSFATTAYVAYPDESTGLKARHTKSLFYREAFSDSADSSWTSRSPPPNYQQFADVSPLDQPRHQSVDEHGMLEHRASTKETHYFPAVSPSDQIRHQSVDEHGQLEHRASTKEVPNYQPVSSVSPLDQPRHQSVDEHGMLEHRASTKEVPFHRIQQVHSHGMESVRAHEGDKEVYFPPEKHTSTATQPAGHIEDFVNPKERRRVCGMKRGLLIALVVLVLVLAVALGVGLGVGLSQKAKSSSSSQAASAYLIGGALNAVYYSTTGAFNGSGIALASESFDGSSHGDLVMYFQHYTGQIRWQQLTDQGQWVGGDETTIVASDARNSTPLSAVAYAMNKTSTWHVFYIDVNNTLRQKTNSNATNVWVEGPLSKQKFKVYNADQVGMQACWYGNDYGDSDYAHTPLPSNGDTSNASITNYQEVGMHMWYASDNQTFQQLGWRAGDLQWTSQGAWENKNGHAGVGCYSWGPGTTTYVMMVNQENTVEFWWKDTNTNLTNTTTHPINEWVNSSIAINSVQPSTSLGYTNIFYAQDAATNNIIGYNITWNSENTTISGAPFTVDGGSSPGLPGTHMSVTAEPSSSGGNNLYVFYQTEGNDITEFTRDIVSGQWSDYVLPIPAS
ncbi:hypothetical protein MBLNU457_7720t2 [Dothideomycetes sp. NU457]